jgi:hypothetical protein
VAVFADSSQVQGRPVTVTRDFLQPPGVSITPSSLRTPGFKYEFFGGAAGHTIATTSFAGSPTIAFTGTILSIAPATPLNMPDAFRYTMSNTNVGLAVRVTTRMLVVTPGEYSFWFTTVWNNWDSFQLTIDGFPVMGHEFWNGTTFDPMFSWYGTCDTTHSIYLPAGEHVVQVLLAEYQGSGSDGAANFTFWYRGPDGVSQQPGTVAQTTGAQFYTIPSYPLTVAASPAFGGSAAVTNSQYAYPYGTPVQIVATPALGFQFTNWSLSGSGSILNATSATTTLTVDGADTVSANFLAITLTGTETATGGAIVQTPSAGLYYTGQVVWITASANAGWKFTSWSATGATLSSSTALSASLTVLNNFSLIALFTEMPFTVTTAAVPPAGGTVAYTPTGTRFFNDVLSIQASPAPGYYFVNWTATGATLGANVASTTATVTNNVSLTASFAAFSYSGTETAAGGTIIASSSGPYIYGQVITVTASAQAGYFFSGWSLSGSCALGNTAAASTTLVVYGNFTLTAAFTQSLYTLTTQVSPAGTGTLTVTPSQATYYYGDTVTITASAGPGYQFLTWLVTGGTVDSPSSSQATLTVQGNVTLTAAFAGPVLVTIDPSSVTWNDATHIMTVQVDFTSSNGNLGNATDFGAELYLTGTDAGVFSGSSSFIRNKTGTQLAGLISGTFAFAAWGGKSTVGNETAPAGVDFYLYDLYDGTDLATIAPGQVVAIYYFRYTGNHADFTQVQAHLCSAGTGDDTQPGFIDLDDGSTPPVTATNNGVNLIPGPLTVMVATSSAWVYQNTAGTTEDRHVVALAVSLTGDNFGNQSYTTTVTQTGPGVVTPTQIWTSGVLVTPATTANWTVPVGGNLSGYLVGGRVSGPVNGSANLALTGSCTVTVSVAGDVGGTATAAVVITVRPLGDLTGGGTMTTADRVLMRKGFNGLPTPNQAAANFDLDGDGVVTANDLLILDAVLNNLALP